MLDQLLADLRSEEGWRPHVYKDHLEFDTIGYGFLLDKRKSAGLPKPVAEFWLRHVVTERIDALRKLWPAFDDQPADVQRALVNMTYQMGTAGLLNFRRMLAALAAGDRVTAAEEAIESTWAKQTPERAKRVAALIRGA
jgi:lysozyme